MATAEGLHVQKPVALLYNVSHKAAQAVSRVLQEWVTLDSYSKLALLVKQHASSVEQALSGVSLGLAGIVSLADIATSSQRTVLTGTATLLDSLVLCPGIHRQQYVADLSKSEYPAAANMVTGYVFRIENPATVYYLQRVGKTGSLTTVAVTNVHGHSPRSPGIFFSTANATYVAMVAYSGAVFLAITAVGLFIVLEDWWAVSSTAVLMFARLLNVLLIRRRSKFEWSGAREEDEPGDLLVLLSQDRWIKVVGKVGDIKAVTSGQWVRDMSAAESWIAAFATVMVYVNVVLVSNATQVGKIGLVFLLTVSAGLLAVANQSTEKLQMHGHVLSVTAQPKRYKRRLDLATELIEEYGGKTEWAVGMGLVRHEDILAPGSRGHSSPIQPVIM
ncbi:uncharacterized protein BO80DRAFT_426309 [Aspergillus ibericus CBS 121593]|uniref:Uncharacterized protein n=1 Tax=Aspergillus ibericus CBS 121593 TaxID=1448316 RepID=A0A395GW78_9EURO|nr:hypothetical protein BO80DRAFT_426309 [Aspergillus ibericus CBS 121593]RAK99619.1 hypothetical protein BO80DRAFT_426309 [Aspergillus ibericus CBS 121593]